MSRTGSGISINRSAETSCIMTAIGNNGARSPGPIGCPVPGCSTGGGGDGRSAARLYQAFGIFSSPSTYFFVVMMAVLIFLPAVCECDNRFPNRFSGLLLQMQFLNLCRCLRNFLVLVDANSTATEARDGGRRRALKSRRRHRH